MSCERKKVAPASGMHSTSRHLQKRIVVNVQLILAKDLVGVRAASATVCFIYIKMWKKKLFLRHQCSEFENHKTKSRLPQQFTTKLFHTRAAAFGWCLHALDRHKIRLFIWWCDTRFHCISSSLFSFKRTRQIFFSAFLSLKAKGKESKRHHVTNRNHFKLFRGHNEIQKFVLFCWTKLRAKRHKACTQMFQTEVNFLSTTKHRMKYTSEKIVWREYRKLVWFAIITDIFPLVWTLSIKLSQMWFVCINKPAKSVGK